MTELAADSRKTGGKPPINSKPAAHPCAKNKRRKRAFAAPRPEHRL